jgi:HAD superfamily hydrolase (TIGR01490 family)
MEAAFFDLDGTIVNLATERVFCRKLYREGLVSLTDLCRVAFVYFKYEIGIVKGYADIKRDLVMAIVKDRSAPEFARRATRFLDECIKPNISRQAIAEINLHQRAGRKVYIISSTLDCIVDPIVDFLGTGERYATRLEVEDGRFTGRIQGEVIYGTRKAILVKEIASAGGIDLNESFAYGDSIQDAEMLRCVGKPCAVNPDRKMASFAKESGWRVVNWK